MSDLPNPQRVAAAVASGASLRDLQDRWPGVSTTVLSALARVGAGQAGKQRAPHRCRNTPEREQELVEMMRSRPVSDVSDETGEPRSYLTSLAIRHGLTKRVPKRGRRGPKLKLETWYAAKLVDIVMSVGGIKAAALHEGVSEHVVRVALKQRGVTDYPRWRTGGRAATFEPVWHLSEGMPDPSVYGILVEMRDELERKRSAA